MPNNNALAELAVRLEQIAEVERESAVFHGDPIDASDDIYKACRIVEELASYYEPCFPSKSGDDVIDNCYAIAAGREAEDGE